MNNTIPPFSASRANTNNEIQSLAKNATMMIANTFNSSLDSFYNNYLLYTDDVNIQKYLSGGFSKWKDFLQF